MTRMVISSVYGAAVVVDAGSSDRAGTAPDALSGAAAGALSGGRGRCGRLEQSHTGEGESDATRNSL